METLGLRSSTKALLSKTNSRGLAGDVFVLMPPLAPGQCDGSILQINRFTHSPIANTAAATVKDMIIMILKIAYDFMIEMCF